MLKVFTKKDQVPSSYKTKEELQKMGKIPTSSPIAKLKEKDRIYYLFDLNDSAPIPSRTTTNLQPTIENLAKALFVVNRHAKTSPQPQKFYQLKTNVIQKLISEGKAEKVGLQHSPNPSKFHQQTCNTLVKIAEYGFHILSTREDLLELPHLGEWNEDFRNPTDSFPLRTAVQLLEQYSQPVTMKKPVSNQRSVSNHSRSVSNHSRVSNQAQRKSLFDPFPKRYSR